MEATVAVKEGDRMSLVPLRWLVGVASLLLVAGVLALLLVGGGHNPTVPSCVSATSAHCVRLSQAQLDATNTPISAVGGLLVGLVLAMVAGALAGWRHLRRRAAWSGADRNR
jgi:ribose/xylose/arabinose/galactoside ABC-type transport system permease subunit